METQTGLSAPLNTSKSVSLMYHCSLHLTKHTNINTTPWSLCWSANKNTTRYNSDWRLSNSHLSWGCRQIWEDPTSRCGTWTVRSSSGILIHRRGGWWSCEGSLGTGRDRSENLHILAPEGECSSFCLQKNKTVMRRGHVSPSTRPPRHLLS